MIALSEITV